jgi:hypothetical protein
MNRFAVATMWTTSSLWCYSLPVDDFVTGCARRKSVFDTVRVRSLLAVEPDTLVSEAGYFSSTFLV